MKCEAVFKEVYDRDPSDIAFCPYRISPLGAHIDHQFGKINGFAIDKGIHIAYGPKKNGVVEKNMNSIERYTNLCICIVEETNCGTVEEKQNETII